ncbi:MAG TPA: P-loop NTPase [Gemmatimonadaceae bacterium]|nr:P-loop NTPase [Gemmatimonadaceae bacterium]
MDERVQVIDPTPEAVPDAAPEAPPDADAIRAALAEVPYPGLTRDLMSFGMVRHVSVCDGRAKVTLALRSGDPAIAGRLETAIAERLARLGVRAVSVVIVEPAPAPAPVPRARDAGDPWADQAQLRAVHHVVAVGAGKGGVGKSTVAVNLALALAAGGLRAGLLDADIYGPSLPILLGAEDRAGDVRMTPEKQLLPLEAHGLPLISFGFFLGEGSPAIWRGPMVSKAVKQFARGVRWPELDVLVVDLPPGTGDVPLSLAQAVQLSGAVVVTQPQRLAGAEAEKAAQMFAALGVPVLGVVENMRGAFGAGEGARVAGRLGVPLLGSVAFDAAMVGEGDAGTPTMVARPESEAARDFAHVAHGVAAALGWRHEAAAAVGRAS